MIPQSFIQELLHRVDIVDVVERHVPLKRAGANYVACCPFHGEKTPSFTVSQSKQFYHCFGCGAHGTAIGFLIEYNGVGFIDAVKDLAQQIGMPVPEIRSERPRADGEGDVDLYAVMLQAAKFYRARLKDSIRAIDYLKRRGLSGQVAKEFGIGYAPDGWQNLRSVFPEYNDKSLVTAGLVIEGDSGKRYDRFRDRIMFPIVDQRGQIIGFGGRVIDQGEPKYLNSPETPLFEKGRELYGLFQARRAIRDTGRVIVVEGYMDVVALAQSGIKYAVATLGTATTATHVQKLLRQTDEVVFCFDGDVAGRRAAWRALENSLDQIVDGKQLSFLFLPQGEDPDTYVRKLGKEAFEKLLSETKPLSEFLLDGLTSRTDIRSAEGLAKLLKETEPLIKKITATKFSLMLREKLAQRTGIPRTELDAQFGIQARRFQRGPAVRAVPAAHKSLVFRLLEILALDAGVKVLADRAALSDGLAHAGADIDAIELRGLDQLLAALEQGQAIVSVGEYFRESEFAQLFTKVEGELLKRLELGLAPEELRSEFADGWSNLLNNIRKSIALGAAGRTAMATRREANGGVAT